MESISYQIKFIILGLIILPMCEYLAGVFFYIIFAALNAGGPSEVLTFMEITIYRVAPYFFEALFLAYKELIVPVAIFIIVYSFYYKANKSFRLMAFIWAVGGALISYHFIWKFLQDAAWGIDEKLTPYALGSFALAGAFAAFLIHLLMRNKNTTPSLHDTFK